MQSKTPLGTRMKVLARLTVAVAALWPLLSCGGSSTSPSPATLDRDGDGFTGAAGDCNDQSATVNPNGTIAVEACVWTNPEWVCPRGSERLPEEEDVVRVRVVNNRCSILSITDAAVQITVLEAQGTFNTPGEKWTSEHLSFSPASIPIGVGGDVLVDTNIVCTNRSGGGSYNVYQAELTLLTSAGAVRCTTANSHTTRFLFPGEPGLGAESDRSGPASPGRPRAGGGPELTTPSEAR
jgi:hypothetical protein